MEVLGKVVVISGAAGGIGSALVDAFLSAGAERILACDLPGERLSALASRSSRILAHPLDVTDPDRVSALATSCPEVQILVNCHGLVIHEGLLAANDIVSFRREMDVNYWGQLMLCRAFAPVVVRNGGGAIINFLSPLGYVTFPFCASYCATKAACRALTEALRAELRPNGTLVMSVCPGAIDTPMMTNLHVPKSDPATVADAVVEGLRAGLEDVWAGEGAAEMKAALDENPAAVRAQAASIITIKDLHDLNGESAA